MSCLIVDISHVPKNHDLIELIIKIMWICESLGKITKIMGLYPLEILSASHGISMNYNLYNINEMLKHGETLIIVLKARIKETTDIKPTIFYETRGREYHYVLPPISVESRKQNIQTVSAMVEEEAPRKKPYAVIFYQYGISDLIDIDRNYTFLRDIISRLSNFDLRIVKYRLNPDFLVDAKLIIIPPLRSKLTEEEIVIINDWLNKGNRGLFVLSSKYDEESVYESINKLLSLTPLRITNDFAWDSCHELKVEWRRRCIIHNFASHPITYNINKISFWGVKIEVKNLPHWTATQLATTCMRSGSDPVIGIAQKTPQRIRIGLSGTHIFFINDNCKYFKETCYNDILLGTRLLFWTLGLNPLNADKVVSEIVS